MEMDKKGMMNEVGGAFVVSWLVFSGMGQGMGTLTGALVLAGGWMAFSGAHILPAVTWMHIMTGDLQDSNHWMNNGMKLLMQVIGAALAVAMMSEGLGDLSPAYDAATTDAWEFSLWAMVGMIAAGAIVSKIHASCDAWVTAIAIMAVAGAYLSNGDTEPATMMLMDFGSAHNMGSMLLGDSGDMADVAMPWIIHGAMFGIGARVGAEIDGAME
ncbi:MAG: hypothetical protein CL962_03060 [Euryarchaeota archaeon]|nr:hypothetical protein [Euryarchaeota archaeon]